MTGDMTAPGIGTAHTRLTVSEVHGTGADITALGIITDGTIITGIQDGTTLGTMAAGMTLGTMDTVDFTALIIVVGTEDGIRSGPDITTDIIQDTTTVISQYT